MRLAIALLLCAGAAFAQEDQRGARFSIGAGVIRAPLYPGSDRYEPRFIPVVTVNFGRFFFGGEMTDKDQGTLVLLDALVRRRLDERLTVNIGPESLGRTANT